MFGDFELNFVCFFFGGKFFFGIESGLGSFGIVFFCLFLFFGFFELIIGVIFVFGFVRFYVFGLESCYGIVFEIGFESV